MSTPTQPGCPFCGEPEGVVDEIYPGTFAVVCRNTLCRAIGPDASWPEAAVILWNARVNRMDWPVSWLPMPDQPCTTSISVTTG